MQQGGSRAAQRRGVSHGDISRAAYLPPADPILAAAVREKQEAVRLEAQSYLEQIAASFEETGLQATIEVRETPVVDAILDTAERLGTDLIALSTHGCSGLAHRFIGAVADRVIHGAKVPVLLIQPTATRSTLSTADPRKVTIWDVGI